ncbi:MAG: hypothetical protein F4W90_06795 [Gammaproteobacteria bacterium]|nr:hypothetical protein [Gammaproteobacteria bacterium]
MLELNGHSVVSSEVLSDRDIEQFDETGLLKVKQAFAPETAAEIRSLLWERFAKWGITRGAPETWQSLDAATIRNVMKSTRRVRSLPAIYNNHSDAIASQLTRSNDIEKVKPLLLLTFSGQHEHIEDEVVPSKIWHLDTPNLVNGAIAGVIALGFVNHVRPGGGGTMVVAGSHRFFNASTSAVTSKIAKRKLRKHRYFSELFSKGTANRDRFLEQAECVEDIEVKVVELTGEPGDVYFVNGSLLHTLTRNYLDDPRMMIRGFYQSPKLAEYYQDYFRKSS